MNSQCPVPPEAPDFAEVFAAFASRLKLEDTPDAVLDVARADILDTMACATAGISGEGVPALLRLVTDWGGTEEARIWCDGRRVPAHHAAWINGMMSHARDFDDTHDAAVLHAGVSVVPAAIAAAERDPAASGADLLAGVTVGLELVCRLGVATKIGIIESGYMYTSLFGHFAATAAAARVMRMETEEMINALGIAYSQAAGTHQVTRDGALTKRMQPGFAAKTALISTALGRAGIRGARETFEGVDGLFNSYFRGEYAPVALRDGLGERFHLADLSFKPFPCCRFNHTAIEAAQQIRNQLAHAGNPEISRIIARVNRQAHEAVGTPIEMRQNPANVVQAQFSIPFTVAAAILDGDVGLAHFTEESLEDERIQQLARRVWVETDPEIESAWSRSISPTRLEVETTAGRFTAQIDLPLGGPERSMTESDYMAKIQGCMAVSDLDWPDDTPVRLREAVWGLTRDGGAQALVECLCPPRGR